MTTESRCPSCGSLVRPQARWCSLCHADLRSEEEKAAARPVPDSFELVEPSADAAMEPAAGFGTDREATDWAAELAALSVPAPRGRHARPSAPTAEPSLPRARRDVPAAPPAAASAVAESRVDAALAEAGVDVQALLAKLAAEPDPLAPLTGRLSTSGSRAVVIAVGTSVLIAMGILTMFVLGSFVH